jgi:hypothetical protein
VNNKEKEIDDRFYSRMLFFLLVIEWHVAAKQRKDLNNLKRVASKRSNYISNKGLGAKMFGVSSLSQRACRVCFEDCDLAWNFTLSGMPEGEEFME